VQWGEEDMEDEEQEGQRDKVFPVSMALISNCPASIPSPVRQASKCREFDSRLLRSPPPEAPWPRIVILREWPLSPPRGPVVERDFYEYYLHDYHDEGLDQQCGVIAGAGPVEDFEDGGCEHDEWDVEREAGRGAGAVDGEDLVRVGGYGGEDETAIVC